MDLTKEYPRSPKERLAGIVSLARTIDKAKAYKSGTLGEYDYDCPHDRPVFDFLGTDGETFANVVAQSHSDDEIVAWLRGNTKLAKKSQAELDAFNADRLHWHPQPGTPSAGYFESMRTALQRPDIETWFDLLDLDEKRAVLEPMHV